MLCFGKWLPFRVLLVISVTGKRTPIQEVPAARGEQVNHQAYMLCAATIDPAKSANARAFALASLPVANIAQRSILGGSSLLGRAAAALPVSIEPAVGRGDAAGARHCRVLRNDPAIGRKFGAAYVKQLRRKKRRGKISGIWTRSRLPSAAGNIGFGAPVIRTAMFSTRSSGPTAIQGYQRLLVRSLQNDLTTELQRIG